MKIKPQQPEVSIEEIGMVLVGDLNPTIFQPMWFAQQGLLRENEAADAKVELVHPDVSAFALEWVTIQALRDKFSATVKAEAYRVHLNDLVQGTFQRLAHSPVKQLGINTRFRIHFRTDDDWHGFGHFLAPKSPWGAKVKQPGLLALNMQGERFDGRDGRYVIMLEGDRSRPGTLLIRVNDHFEKPADLKSQGSAWISDILQDGYDASFHYARSVVDDLIASYMNQTEVDSGA
jgi:hypothetical protein